MYNPVRDLLYSVLYSIKFFWIELNWIVTKSRKMLIRGPDGLVSLKNAGVKMTTDELMTKTINLHWHFQASFFLLGWGTGGLFCLYLLYLNNIDKRHWPLYKKIFFVRTPTPYLAAHVGLIVEFVEVDETSKDDAHILVILRIFGGFFQLVWHVLWYNVVKQPVSLKRKKIFVLLQSRIINTKINK